MHKLIFLITITSALLSIGYIQAQSNITTTPAPTKTPIPHTTEEIETPQEPNTTDQEHNSSGAVQYTQSDLNTITGNVQRPNGMIWHEDNLYIICNGDWTIYEVNDTTGETRTYIYGVRNGHALYSENDENGRLRLWVPDADTNQLLRVNPVRSPEPIIQNLERPWGITYLDENNFLITSITENTISRVNRNGQVDKILSELRSPTGITKDENYIYFANNGSARRAIEWIDITEESLVPKPLISGLQNTTNITMAADGNLYFTYAIGTRGVIGRVNPEECRDKGGCQNSDVEIVVLTELAAPLAGLTISPDMRLFVHTMFRPEIYWLQLPEAN